MPDWTVVNLDVADSRRFEWGLTCDLLVLFQSQDLDLIPLIHERRRRGLATIAEYNDHFYSAPVASPVFDGWTSPFVWKMYEKILAVVDGVIATCESLKNVLSPKTPAPIQVLRNFLPDRSLKTFDDLTEKWNLPQPRLCWGGSMGHFPDLLSAMPFVRQLMQEIPQLHLSLMGNDMIPSHVTLPRHRFTFRHWGSMNDYFEFLESSQFGFVPLLNNPYNKCRSDIKALEMISRGVFPILPDAPPYREILSLTGLPAYKNFDEMQNLIRWSISDRLKSKQALRLAYDYVCENRLRSSVVERRDYYARFLRGEASSSSIPRSAGYHEIKSERDFSPAGMAIHEAQQALKSGVPHSALKILSDAIVENSQNIELKVIRLQILRKIGDHGWMDELKALSEEESSDYRVKAMKIETLTGEPLRQSLLHLQSDISALNENARKHLLPSIGSLLIRLLQREPQLLGEIEPFVPLFRRFVQLRIEVAKAMLNAGRREQATAEFEKLLDVSEIVEWSREGILSLSPAYFRSLVESAKANSKQIW